MNAPSLLDRTLFAPRPATRLASMRILIAGFAGVYLAARASHLTNFSAFSPAEFTPVGPVSLLASPLSPALVYASFAVALVSALAACAGAAYRWSGPMFALSTLWVLSYRNSWGMIFHTENLLVMCASIVAVAPAADVWSWDARRRPAPKELVHGRYGWALLAMQWVLVLSYLVAGIAKLRAAGFEWTAGAELRSHIAFDAVRKLELGSTHSALGAALVSHSWVFPPLAWLTLAFELGAPLSLLGQRWAIAWCALAWSFHLGVLVLMAIVFPYPLLGIAYAPYFAIEKPFERWLWPFTRRLFGTAPSEPSASRDA